MTDTLHPPGQDEAVVVVETGVGRYQVEAQVGSSTFLVDEPVSAGGLGSGPNPYDLLSAALGACTAMTLRLYANRQHWPLQAVKVSVVHRRSSLDARDVFAREIHLEGDLDEDQRAHLLAIAERCPVHLSLERGAQVRTVLLPPEPPPSHFRAYEAGEHMRGMSEAVAEATP
jgi:putative redox protein